MLVPNIRVSFKSALYGAFFSGITWEFVGSLFANFASGSTSYTAIYSGFAILILFMIWLYLGWVILLTGVNISYYHQHPERLSWDLQKLKLNGEMHEQTLLNIMLYIAKKHAKKTHHEITLPFLSSELHIPSDTLLTLIQSLEQCDLIKASNDTPKQYLPATSLDLISVSDILQCARSGNNDSTASLPSDPSVSHVMQQIKQSNSSQFSSITLASLIHQS